MCCACTVWLGDLHLDKVFDSVVAAVGSGDGWRGYAIVLITHQASRRCVDVCLVQIVHSTSHRYRSLDSCGALFLLTAILRHKLGIFA